ncbi:hypothetical protein Bca4012_033817 [Brassica carinata]|uniref:Arp2/3 complex 34 kDa subunit n=1 Tax=Brassica napus TaxID=3708 RepID=A0A078GGJ1_BRANA|nr:unnamed protein product [Brassica napus]CDY23743.1 BnaC04g43790D [Brassica napus]
MFYHSTAEAIKIITRISEIQADRTAVFPMNFRDDSDVVPKFKKELVEVGSQNEMGKAPQCSWSPVPPFQLRREPVQDLTTNSGFISFDITSRHVEGKRVLDTTVWNLLNFYAYVEYHIKCSRGYIQRRMRKGMDSLAKVFYSFYVHTDEITTSLMIK